MVQLLLRFYRFPILNRIAYLGLKCLGVEIPTTVKFGKNLYLPHWASGLVVHSKVEIGDNVRLYQGVTIGRSDIFQAAPTDFKITIGNDVVLCAGAKLLANCSCTVEDGVIIGANSVLIVKESVVTKGVYVGLPARKIR